MVQTSTLILEEITRCSVISSVLLMIFNSEKVKEKKCTLQLCSCWHLEEWAASLGPWISSSLWWFRASWKLKYQSSVYFYFGMACCEDKPRQRTDIMLRREAHGFYEASLPSLIKIFFVWRNPLFCHRRGVNVSAVSPRFDFDLM